LYLYLYSFSTQSPPQAHEAPDDLYKVTPYIKTRISISRPIKDIKFEKFEVILPCVQTTTSCFSENTAPFNYSDQSVVVAEEITRIMSRPP